MSEMCVRNFIERSVVSKLCGSRIIIKGWPWKGNIIFPISLSERDGVGRGEAVVVSRIQKRRESCAVFSAFVFVSVFTCVYTKRR